MVSALRTATEAWARGEGRVSGPLSVVEQLRTCGPVATSPDPDLLTLRLPETDHEGLVEAVVGVDAEVCGERVSRLRWRRRGGPGSADWRLVDLFADGWWRSEAWCLHPRMTHEVQSPDLVLTAVALSTVTTPGWLAAGEVRLRADGPPTRIRWRPRADEARHLEADVTVAQPVTLTQRGPAGTSPMLAVEVIGAPDGGGHKVLRTAVAMPHGHPREGWCEIPDPLPLPRRG